MNRYLVNEEGNSTAAAAIGAFATVVAAIIGGLFLLASTRDSNRGPTLPTDPGGTEIGDLDDMFDDMFEDAAVYLSLDNGPTGTTVNVSGEGFRSDERIVLQFHTDQIGTTQANDAGRFANVAVEIPSGYENFAPQQFSIIAVGQASSRSARAPFTLTG
jgi:hypothetical protein